jgi:hypothetical protein
MASNVDTTLPADNVKSSKADFRAQFLVIFDEITALQKRTGVAGAKAFYGFVDDQDLRNEVTRVHNEQAGGFAEDIAYGRIAINTT